MNQESYAGGPQPDDDAPGSDRIILHASLADEPPAAVLIAPWGEVRSSSGSFVVDEESVRSAIEDFAAHKTDLPVDYEHQTLGGAYASPTGQAPAAGWIRALRAVRPEQADQAEPGLYADVEWTDAARARLVAREYRYLSPVVLIRREDRRIVAVHSVALTNKPAIVGMKPIINGSAAATTVSPEDALEVLRLRVGLPQDSPQATVLAAAAQRIAEMEEGQAARQADERVVAATRAGKLPGNLRAWALSLARTDPAAFDAWLTSAPVVVPMGQTEPPADREHGDRERIAASARTTFRREPALALLTSEEAWIREALREAGPGQSQE